MSDVRSSISSVLVVVGQADGDGRGVGEVVEQEDGYTMTWRDLGILRFLERGIFEGKASAIDPVKEVKTFDKTGWTPVGWQPPQDTVRPIFVMRAEWDTPSFWPDGWGVGKNPYMNIVGLYWKYADKEEGILDA